MMEILLIEWANLILRWLHIITGIAWIGASFYFVWLDNNLEAPPDWKKDKGISGDLWAFHGGGIYEVGKYSLAPTQMPKTLHWFKWEAYSTWITGGLLLIVLYYVKADLYLVGQGKWLDTPTQVILASVVFIFSGFFVYELLVRSALGKRTSIFAPIFVMFVAFVCWLSTMLFSDRAAFLHVGAMLATIMAANVFIGIIPAQKKFMLAVENGEIPEKGPMLFAKTRSVHNNYLTLPVLFCMISNHYAFLYSHVFNWIILFIIIATTAYARHFFNLRHKGIVKPQILVISSMVTLGVIAFMAWFDTQSTPSPSPVSLTASKDPLMTLVQTHCTVCHAKTPTQAGFSAAPAGMILENMDQVLAAQAKIYTAIESNYMPLANITGMTEEERAELLVLLK